MSLCVLLWIDVFYNSVTICSLLLGYNIAQRGVWIPSQVVHDHHISTTELEEVVASNLIHSLNLDVWQLFLTWNQLSRILVNLFNQWYSLYSTLWWCTSTFWLIVDVLLAMIPSSSPTAIFPTTSLPATPYPLYFLHRGVWPS